MFAGSPQPLPWVRRPPARPLLACAVLGGLLVAGYPFAGPAVRGAYHYRLAERALQRRDFEQADLQAAECLKHTPRSYDAHLLAARAARHRKHSGEAESHLTVCQRLRGDTDAVSLERAFLLAQEAQLPPWMEGHLQDLIEHNDPEAPEILEVLSQGAMQARDLRRAGYYLGLWLERDPDNAQALSWRGWWYEHRRAFDQAAADYRRALQLDPGRDPVRLSLALLLLNHGDHFVEAEPLLAELYQRHPDQPDVVLGLAQCREDGGRLDEAAQLLDAYLADHPSWADGLVERGKIALARSEIAKAEPWLRKAVELAPYHRNANYHLYLCLTQLGKAAEAKVCKARLDEVASDEAQMEQLLKRLEDSPADPDLRAQVGELYLRHGEDLEGVQWLNSALRLEPAHRRAHEALAEYYEHSGQADLVARHRLALLGPSAPTPPVHGTP